MHISEIWRPKHAFRAVGTLVKENPHVIESQRQHEIVKELNLSLLAVMYQTATNRDYAKLIRHGYEDMHLRLNGAGKVVGLRYTMEGKQYIATVWDGGIGPHCKLIFREPILNLQL